MAEVDNVIKTTVVLSTSQAEQQIVKLNAVASDSTKSLEERIVAKNKQVEITNQLSKQTIAALNNERRTLEGMGASEKDLMAIKVKLDKANLAAVKTTENNTKAQNKLAQAFADSKNPVKNLDEATGGLLGKFKAFLSNPIGIAITALAGLFSLFSEAVNRSEGASTSFGKVAAKLSGIFNGLMAALGPVVEFLGDKLLSALNDPKQAIIDLGETIQQNLINRVTSFLVLGDAIEEFFKGNFAKAGKLAADGLLQFTTGVEGATDKISDFIDSSKELYDAAATATDSLVDAEKRLARNRIALEKQQLISLRAAEEERQIRDDTSKSIDERIAANRRLGSILESQAKAEMGFAKDSLGIARAQMAATGSTIENIEAVGAAEVKLLEIQERISGQRSEQLVNEVGLIKEKADLAKRDAAAEIEIGQIRLDRMKANNEETLALELDLLQRKRSLELQELGLTNTEKELIIAQHKDAVLELEAGERLKKEEFAAAEVEVQILKDEAELETMRTHGDNVLAIEAETLERRRAQELANADLTEAEKVLINAKYNAIKIKNEKTYLDATKKSVDEAAQQGAEAAAEAFGISQELKIAQLVMSAPEAVGNSFTKAAEVYPAPLSLAMGALGAAGVVVPIIKGLNDIKKARFPGSKKRGGGGSVSMPSSGGGGAISSSAITDIAANNSARLGVDPSLGLNAGANAANNVMGGASSNIVFSENKYNQFQNQITFKEQKTSI